MDTKDKLKLAIRMNETVYTSIDYDKKEMFEKFDNKLKAIDDEHISTLDIPKYILMIVAKITKLSKDEQDKVGLYLFNKIWNFCLCVFDKFA